MTLTLETVGLYAETLVRQAAAAGVTLDYSRESLGTLDGLLAGSDPQFPQATQTQRELVIFYAGCYVGETIIRGLSRAQWQLAAPWQDSTVVVLGEQNGVELRPFEKLERRLSEGGESHHLVAYYDGILELLPTGNV